MQILLVIKNLHNLKNRLVMQPIETMNEKNKHIISVYKIMKG